MKRKRFYKNVKRNRKWTESAKGRHIDFADKYADGGLYTDKFDYMRPKKSSRSRQIYGSQRLRKALRIIPILLLCLAVLNAGYAIMGVYINRHAMPKLSQSGSQQGAFNTISLQIKSRRAESLSLDGSVMLENVINDARGNGRNSVSFDIKRSDGTLGYTSSLANADAYGAVASPAANLGDSISELTRQEILPVGIVWCYADNIAPRQNTDLALKNADGSVYEDKDGGTYLNPDTPESYGYIKDIIAEASAAGVKVFALCATELPDDISDAYNDGFDTLAERLYKDIGTDIKLLEAVEISLDGEDAESLSEIIPEYEEENTVYYIVSSADESDIKEKLEDGGISSYILAEK